MAVRYANYSKNTSTVSHEFTPGGGDPHAKTSSVNRVALHYAKKDGGEKNASENIALEMDNASKK